MLTSLMRPTTFSSLSGSLVSLFLSSSPSEVVYLNSLGMIIIRAFLLLLNRVQIKCVCVGGGVHVCDDIVPDECTLE